MPDGIQALTGDLVDRCAREVTRVFLADPFEFPAEKALHARFEQIFHTEQRKFGEFALRREYPVLVEDFEFGQGTVKHRKDAYIDFVVGDNAGSSGGGLCGIEMFLGKDLDQGSVRVGSHAYSLQQSSCTGDQAAAHLRSDCWKLRRATPDNYLLLYFIVHAFETRSSAARQDERVRRIMDITNALKSCPDVDLKRLWIIESIFLDRQKTTRRALGLPAL